MKSKIKVGIVGGTGYTGVELLRLLVFHPQVQVLIITSRAQAGKSVADLFPNLRGHFDLRFTEPTLENLAQCDVVFFATPNGTAMQSVPELLNAAVSTRLQSGPQASKDGTREQTKSVPTPARGNQKNERRRVGTRKMLRTVR